jgi:5,10-methenyltetrahydromethanopterin hydrogenase
VHYLEEQEIALKHPSTDYGCELRNLVGKASQIRFNMLHPME